MEEAAEEELRIARRAKRPMEIAMSLFTTKDYEPILAEHTRILTDIMNNPYAKYIELRDRLRKDGPTASFPEFKGTVAKLTQAIYQDPVNQEIIAKDSTLQNLRELLTHSLIAIQIEGRYVFPYKATILMIDEMLKFLDILSRKKRPDLPGYYHNLRYRLYLTYLLDQASPEAVVFPTVYFIGSTFLVRTRCVPIQFLGVAVDATHADQYDNSPIDFFAHDIQHSRRLIQENQRYYDIVLKHLYYYTKRSAFDFITMEQFYKEQEDFTKFLVNLIKLAPTDTPKEKAYKNIKKLIIFEVVHEKGWPITKFSLCRNIPLGYDIFPIETMVETDGSSGIKIVDDKFQDPTTLSNVYQKLRKGFYDKVTAPDTRIVDPVFRTAKDIAHAAQELLGQIQCKSSYTFEKLLALTEDPKGAEEFTEKAAEIAFPNDRDDSVLERNPTQLMKYWQVEDEAPLIVNSSVPVAVAMAPPVPVAMAMASPVPVAMAMASPVPVAMASPVPVAMASPVPVPLPKLGGKRKSRKLYRK